jgi:hypothetical protein
MSGLLCAEYPDYSYKFNENGQFSYIGHYNYSAPSNYYSCDIVYVDDSGTETGTGTWEFSSNKTKLMLQWTGDNSTYSFDIKELREKEMMLEANIDGDNIKMTFEKK